MPVSLISILMEELAIRLSHHNTMAKSLVISRRARKQTNACASFTLKPFYKDAKRDSGTAALRKSSYPFAHGAQHQLSSGVTLFDSYHCSCYNTQTKRLTSAMFESVIASIVRHLGSI